MTSFRYLLKLKKKGSSKSTDTSSASNGGISSNKDLLKGDLYCHLTYMAALSTSNLSRNLLFEYASSLPYTSSKYIRKVHFLAKKLNYDYSEACRIVGNETKEPEPKAILLRMANSFASGEKEADFMDREAQVIGETYGDEYERAVESLKKWTDAYVALILSASLVVVVSVVSMLIFPMKPSYIVTLTWMMLMTTVLGAWIMYRASPKDVKTHSFAHTSMGQKIGRELFKFMVVPMAIMIVLVMLLLKANLGLAMLATAVIVLPTGFFYMWDDKKIDKFDADIPSFLRSLGSITKAIGTTITEALGRIDLRALGSLRQPVYKLSTSLLLGIKPELCWRRFVGSTGSEHVNRSVQIFWDGIAVGGDPELVGNQTSKFAMRISLLRGKRQLISSSFSYTCVVIHATIAVLLIGIYQVLVNFSKLLQNMGDLDTTSLEAISSLPTFQFFADSSSSLQLLDVMVTSMLVVLTVVNAVAVKVVEGGHNLKFLFYLGIMLIVSGLSLLIVPGLLKGIFSVIEIAQ
jgi:flagellar protein FlaJ